MVRSTLHDAPHADKVRYVFNDLSKDATCISREKFISAFHSLRITLSTEQLTELFSLGAVTREGQMSFPEFQMWAEQFPTILDSLYFRLRDHEDDSLHRTTLVRLRERLETLKDHEKTLLDRHQETLDQMADVQARIEQEEDKRRRAMQVETQLRIQAEDARRETEDLRGRVRRDQGELAALREEERQRQGRIEIAQRETQSALTSLRAAEADLREIQRELKRRQADVDARKEAVRKAYDREGHLASEFDDVGRNVKDQEKAIALTEDELERYADTEREATQGHRSSLDAIREAEEALDRLSREMRTSDESVHAAAAQIDACQDEIRSLGREFDELENDNDSFNAHRKETADEETELLREEIALRKQRLALETREAKLRNKTYPRRSTSPDARSPAAASRYSMSPLQQTPHSIDRERDPSLLTLRTMSPEPGRRLFGASVHYTPRAEQDRHVLPPSAPTPATHPYTPYLSKHTPNRSAASPYSKTPVGSTTPLPRSGSERRSSVRRPSVSHLSEASGKLEAAPSETSPPRCSVDPVEAAAKLHKAMKGFGTDEGAIYGVLTKVKIASDWTEIKRAFAKEYPKFYGGELVKAMEGDLTKKELEKCSGILQEKGVVL